MKHPLALILGVDTPIGLAVARELGRHGVPVHGIGRSSNAVGRSSRYLSGFSLRPEGLPLVEWLPERIFHTGARALFAISEEDLIALAALPQNIEGCHVLTPRKPQLDLVLDKGRTLALASGYGIDVPESWQPVAGESFAQYADTLAYPVVAKWADPPEMVHILTQHGLPLIKAEHISDKQALLALLERYAPLREWPIIQPFCPGVGFGQMLHMAGARASLKFQHRRLHEWPPEGGVSTLCESVPLDRHAHQMEKSEALLKAIGWSGPAMVEYRLDAETGKYWLMEVNGRFWGSLPLAQHCGAEFAWEQYRHAILEETGIGPQIFNQRRARFMIPETRRLIRVLFGREPIPNFRRTPLRDLLNFVAGFVDPRMRYFVFAPDDMGPFLHDLTNVIRKALRRERLSPD